MNNGTFDFNDFLKESKDVLFNPKSYFSSMKISGGMTEPLLKAIMYGIIAGLFSFLWDLLKIEAEEGLLSGSVGIMSFLLYIIAAVIGLYVGTLLLLIISSICKGSTDFETNIRVTASLMIVMPLSTFLGFLSGINFYIGIIIGLAVNIFMLWLLYNALIGVLRSKPETAKIVTYILVTLFVLFMLLGLGAKRTADRFMNDYNSSDAKELLKDID